MATKLIAPWIFSALWLAFPSLLFSQDSNSANLLRALPEKCLMMSWWDNTQPAPENSQNKADQLFAEPEVRRFIDSVLDSTADLTKMAAVDLPASSREKLAVVVPHLVNNLCRGSGCFFLETLEFDESDLQKLDFALILSIGDDAKIVSKLIRELFEAQTIELQPIEFGKYEFFEFIIPPREDGANTFSLYFGDVNGNFLVGAGEQSLQRTIDRLADKEIAPWVRRIQDRIPLKRRTSMGYLNIAGVREMALKFAPPELAGILASLGLDNLESLESSNGYDDVAMTNRILFRFDGEPSGIFDLIGKHGIDESSLQHIPSDALFAVAGSMELGQVFDFVMAKLEEFDPRAAQDIQDHLADFEQEIGVDLRTDFFGQVGPGFTLHNGSADGVFAGLTLTADLKDSERFADAVSRVGSFIMGMAQHLTGAPKWIDRRHGNDTISTLSVAEFPLPFEFSFCITKGKLLVTLYPQAIRSALAGHEKPLFDEQKMNRSFGPESTESRLAGLIWVDSQRQFEFVYPMVQMAMAMRYQAVLEAPPKFRARLRSLLEKIELPPGRSIHQHLVPSITVLRRVSDGFELESQQTVPMVDVTASLPIAVAMILPAVQQVRAASMRTTSLNNVRQMALALHNYESAHLKLPSGFGPMKQDGPAVSWRVKILPFIEQNQLYQQYRFDEPWDSENNLRVLDQMPDVFRCPTSNAPANYTVYLGIGGRNGIFGKDAAGKSVPTTLAGITDGTSNTALIVEAGDGLAVPWTKPDEGINPDDFDPTDLLGHYPGGFVMGMADGSAHFISQNVSREVLKLLFEMSDGQVVPYNELFR